MHSFDTLDYDSLLSERPVEQRKLTRTRFDRISQQEQRQQLKRIGDVRNHTGTPEDIFTIARMAESVPTGHSTLGYDLAKAATFFALRLSESAYRPIRELDDDQYHNWIKASKSLKDLEASSGKLNQNHVMDERALSARSREQAINLVASQDEINELMHGV